MAIDAKAFGPAAARTAVQSSPAIYTALTNPVGAWRGFADSSLGRLATNPTSLSGTDAAGLGGIALGLGAGFVDDPAAKAAMASTAYGLTAAANPFMAAWNAPAFVNSISNIIEGPETEIRRAKRTRDANILGSQIVSGLREPGGLDRLVGGSTAGDALAAMLKHNRAGTWFADTAHGWYPDPSYGGLDAILRARGFTGDTEPTLNDVGGVGEIVAGSGTNLIPRSYLDAYEQAWRNQSSGRDGTSGTYGGYTGASAGSLGWESLLHGALQAPGPSYVMPTGLPGSSPLSRANTAILPEYVATDRGLTMEPRPSVEWSEDGQTFRNGVRVDPWEALLPAPPPESGPDVLDAYRRRKEDLIANATMSTP